MEIAFSDPHGAADVGILFAFCVLGAAIGGDDEPCGQAIHLILEAVEPDAGNLDLVDPFGHPLEFAVVVVGIHRSEGRHAGLEASGGMRIGGSQSDKKLVCGGITPDLEGHHRAARPNVDLFQDDFQGFFTFALKMEDLGI